MRGQERHACNNVKPESHLVPARGRAVGPSGRGLAPTVGAGSLELCRHTCHLIVRTEVYIPAMNNPTKALTHL